MKKTIILAGALSLSMFFVTEASASSYSVKSGDTLFSISRQYNVPLEQLKSNNKLASNLIRVGQVLQLDRTSSVSSTTTTSAKVSSSYTVKGGDTLFSVAKAYGLTLNEIVKLNPTITNTSKIFVGQKIVVSASVSSKEVSISKTSVATTSATTYTVKTGDTLYAIAAKFGLSLKDILSYNSNIVSVSKIYVGQVIKLSNIKNAPVSTGTKESTTSIATKVLNSAKKYLGVRYLYGASVNRKDAFDCSSFTYRAFLEGANISLPRTSLAQSNFGKNISLSSLQIGDLVFFDTDFDGVINHVGIYIGNGQMINAATSQGVSYASITNGYWKERIVKAQRIL